MTNRIFLMKKLEYVIKGSFLAFILLGSVSFAEAASLYLSPATGVYQSNATFSVRVMVNTKGQPINAAEASISYNPRELSVVSANRSGSIFNLWVVEPTFSNSAGTINFSGGLPSGYTGSAGNVMTITFRAMGSGPAKVNFSKGSVLANDGKGTNVLTTMSGGTYTIQTASIAPTPEVIEYVAPANTPAAPVISSATHGDPTGWSNKSTAELTWKLPAGVTAVRTLLDENPNSIPTKVYEDPISSITLSDLPDGESYLHIQFQNEDGWGRVTHYRMGVDTERPTSFEITQAEDNDFSNPEQTLFLEAEDATSEVRTFKIKIDSEEPYDYVDETGSSTLLLPVLSPGYHTLIIEALDEAGNSIVGSYSFTIQAFDRPVFVEYPTEINEEVIPVIKGMTRPNSEVEISLQKLGSEPRLYQVTAADDGQFTFIPEGTFSQGVYELSAVATDSFGAISERSEVIKMAVQQPGYLRIGGFVVSILSVVIPLLALLIIGGFSLWYLILYFARFRSKVSKESTEALEILHREFLNLQSTLRDHESQLQKSRKTKKLTKAEAEMIEAIDRALQSSQSAVEKEIIDVTKLSKKK